MWDLFKLSVVPISRSHMAPIFRWKISHILFVNEMRIIRLYTNICCV